MTAFIKDKCNTIDSYMFFFIYVMEGCILKNILFTGFETCILYIEARQRLMLDLKGYSAEFSTPHQQS